LYQCVASQFASQCRDYTAAMNPPSRILVVDDDPALRELLSAYLTDTGFVVDLAGDGAGMRRAIEQARPDAIVLDLMLPGEDGLMLTRMLWAQAGAAAAIPVLILSARGEETDRVVGLEMGADDYLAKPFSPRELLARLRALLRRAQAAPSVPDQDTYRFGPIAWTWRHGACSRTTSIWASRARNSICSKCSPNAPIGC
jgi:DNA-binding response OmpR family regulator